MLMLPMLPMLTMAMGCASTTARPVNTKPRQYSFWPQFPEEPHVQFLASYRYSSDIDPKTSKLEDLLYGKDSGILPIMKPYGVQIFEGKIYVCDIKNPGVVVLDIAKHQTRIMKTNGLGGMVQPTDIAISPDATKYVADSVRGVIFVFDAKERHINSFGEKGLKPVGIAVYQDKLYVSDFATKSVKVMDRHTGKILSTIGGPGGEDGKFVRPLGIAVDQQGDIFVSDVIKSRLQEFDPQGTLVNAVGQIGDTAGSFARPKHIAVDKSGIVYVADAAFDNVQMFNDKGQVLMYFGNGGSHPGAMNLPAGVCSSEDDVQYFKEYIHPAFDAERIVLVTNQFGPNKVSVYAIGHLREGATVQDIAANRAEVASGLDDPEKQTPNSEKLPQVNPPPQSDENPSPQPNSK